MPQDPRSGDSELSGRIKTKRRSHRESGKRSRLIGADSTGNEHISDEDDESLEQKLARLRREVAEVKADFDRTAAQEQDGTKAITRVDNNELESLSEVLNSAVLRNSRSEDTTASRLIQLLGSATSRGPDTTGAAEGHNGQPGSTYKFSYAPEYHQQHAIARIADFDTRLTLLESVLGVDTIAVTTQARRQDRGIIPTLAKLDRQVSSVSASTESNLDSAIQRLRQLTLDALKLADARKSAKVALEELINSRNIRQPSALHTHSSAHDLTFMDEPEQISKINALYGTLPTIESLSPLLPPLLDRLRSMRLVHADAANAHNSLAQIESRQEAMAEDIRSWRAGLEKVEAVIEQEQKTMSGNMNAVEGWVKELEDRMDKYKPLK